MGQHFENESKILKMGQSFENGATFLKKGPNFENGLLKIWPNFENGAILTNLKRASNFSSAKRFISILTTENSPSCKIWWQLKVS